MKLLPVAVSLQRQSPTAGGSIELGGAVRVRVDAAVDEAALGRVLHRIGIAQDDGALFENRSDMDSCSE